MTRDDTVNVLVFDGGLAILKYTVIERLFPRFARRLLAGLELPAGAERVAWAARAARDAEPTLAPYRADYGAGNQLTWFRDAGRRLLCLHTTDRPGVYRAGFYAKRRVEVARAALLEPGWLRALRDYNALHELYRG